MLMKCIAPSFAVLAGLVLVAGCDSPSDPTDSLTIDLSVSLLGPPYDDAGILQCGARITARPLGSTNASVTWRGGLLYFYAGIDRTTPIDTLVLQESDVTPAWSGRLMSVDSPLTSSWNF